MDVNIVKSPINVSFAFQKSESESDSQLDCAKALGSMMYIMKHARSNIKFTINKLGRLTSDPNKNH